MSLCAELIAPPPCAMFSRTHTQPFSPRVSWSHYVDLSITRSALRQRLGATVLGRDGAWARATLVAPSEALARPANATGGADLRSAHGRAPGSGRDVLSHVLRIESDAARHGWNATHALQMDARHHSFEREYTQAKDALARGVPFEWHLSHLWYLLPLPSLTRLYRHVRAGDYVQLASSEDVRAVASSVLTSVGLSLDHSSLEPEGGGRAEYVTLHVRRGDAQKVCDSSIAAVASYVACSLGNLVPLMSVKPRMLLFFTDETDPRYLAALSDALRQVIRQHAELPEGLYGSSMRVEHGDALVAHLSSDVENNFRFAVSMQIQAHAATQLERSRQRCAPCDMYSLVQGTFAELVDRDFHFYHPTEFNASDPLSTRHFFDFDGACTPD